MKVKTVRYGRTIEVGRFGHGPHGKVWFGWEAELEPEWRETEEEVMKALHVMADEQEMIERRAFAARQTSPLAKTQPIPRIPSPDEQWEDRPNPYTSED